jgi:hypothetical protein
MATLTPASIVTNYAFPNEIPWQTMMPFERYSQRKAFSNGIMYEADGSEIESDF